MSRMLNLVDELLSRSRHFQHLGRHREALHLLTRLADFRELPVCAAEEIEVRVGEIYLRRRQFKRARRHLVRAVRHQPDNANYHYLLATALNSGRRPHTHRALEHYRRSLELEPDQPARLCAYGLLLTQTGKSSDGLRHLRRAVEVAPADIDIIRQVVKGMRLANRSDEARRLLLTARFRNPRDRHLLALWDDFQFHQLRKDQQQAGRERIGTACLNAPALLPFVRTESDAIHTRQARTVWRDAPSGLPAPRGLLRVRRPDQRHAQ